MSYPFTLTLREVTPVTHDTRRFRFDRPEGFEFEAGQATHLAMDRAGWREQDRPFTMVSDPGAEELDFIIKIYPDHDGVTARMDDLTPGDQVLADDPEGAITDHGPGTFLAAGAGITPFIPILDQRAKRGEIAGCRLIFSNRSARDIILREHWEEMEGLDTVFPTDQPGDGMPDGPIDREFLDGRLVPEGHVYLCGPGGFVDAMRDAARAIGVPDERIVTEAGW
ncbi:FAD-binding oxidoreductase [Roseibacterium sp. SDUM158017]|uniref:FAD-binding oxidoreductase n=1 Tax=Roseicyclus salinarum TaxID=3036773 RepID=UPI0024156AD2|nr:FAD-binding oxidoreductase [Roseibacterium sp. SDUM158017]MDG4648155.1 FAD-binding oxidoreductase [Roseibacterium sp. SDUM158017]